MARSGAAWVLVCVFAACGGEGVRTPSPVAAAGVAGTTAASAGSGGNGAAGGSTPQAATAGTVDHAGAAGRASGNTGGSDASGGDGGAAGGMKHGGTGGMAPISTPEMLVPTATAFCAAARNCCAKQTDPVMLGDCESGFAKKDQTSQALARGTVTIDAVDLGRCQAAYQAAATSCEENGVLAACAGIVKGKLAEGAPCTLGVECEGAGPKVCLVTGGQDSLGVCKTVPGGKAGEECSLTCRPGEICTFTVYGIPDSSLTPCLERDGVFCDTDSSPARCQALFALGAPCERDDQCGSAAYCDSFESGTCKKRGQLNEPCGTCLSSLTCRDRKCQSPPLTVGSTCSGYPLGPY